MTVTVIGHMHVDVANVAKVWSERKADFEAVAERARAHGALHHQWAFGDGVVVIIDEWSDAASFERFFNEDTVIPELMASSGVEGPPTFEILETRHDAPDEF